MPLIMFETAGPAGFVALDVEYLNPEHEAGLLAEATEKARPALNRSIVQLRQRENIWAAQATEAQNAIGWGDHFAYRWTPATDPVFRTAALAGPVTIYGRIPTREEFRRAEYRASGDLGEVGASMATLDRAYTRGWRHATCWSQVSPEGEIGDVHVALMIPLTPAQFRAAKAAGWPQEIPAP